MPQFAPEAEKQNKALLDLLQQLAEEKGGTPGQISLAWILCKKPYLVPIPGTRKLERLKENGAAADVLLNDVEVKKIDEALEAMEMSEVFGGSKVVKG